MRIFDTLSGEKKELKQPKAFGIFKKPINMFVCGPTVYDYPHIGNARTFVFFDMFTRYLRSQGIQIKYLQNITDIDDKIIQKAKDENTTWQEVSKKYEAIYFADLKALGVDTANMQFAKATEFIPEIIAQVKRLRDKGFAYKIDGDGWYFDITKYVGYGELAHRTVQQAEDGVTRVDNSDKKRNAGDFCLWKLSSQIVNRESQIVEKAEPSWENAELGAGRPGWHIEDTAITEKILGAQYDIHGGAIDLKFPHHEAERAQQESASGKTPFVNIWMHAGFLTINGAKMSKSLGNFLTVDDVLKKMTADEFRMMLLMTHYRKPLDFTDERMHSAKKVIAQTHELLWELIQAKSEKRNEAMENEFAVARQKFDEFINDDFDTYKAFGLAIGVLENQAHALRGSLTADQALEISNYIKKIFAFFGIILPTPEIPEQVQKLLEQRELSRVNKQFAQSDALRKEIEGLGYVIEDTPAGPLVLPKS